MNTTGNTSNSSKSLQSPASIGCLGQLTESPGSLRVSKSMSKSGSPGSGVQRRKSAMKRFTVPFFHRQGSMSRDRRLSAKAGVDDTELQELKAEEEDDNVYSDAEDSQYYSEARQGDKAA